MNDLNQLRSVNERMNNKITYVADEDQYHLIEMWECANQSGDCEDYAIAKLHTLLTLGWDIEKLRLATCFISNQPDQGHAILLAELNNRLYVLDNRFTDVWEVNDYSDYFWGACQEYGGSKNWVPCYDVFSRFYTSE